MKIGLVMCGISRMGWNSWQSGLDDECYVPPGLALLTATCKRAGHEVVPIDLRKMRGWDDFCAAFQKADCHAYGFSCMTTDYGIALAAANLIRQSMPKVPLIVGGVHPSICPSEMEKDLWDYIIVGEGEESLPTLLAQLDKGEASPRVIAGVHPNLDSLPFPDRDAWDFMGGEMINPPLRKTGIFEPPFAGLITSRGCPYRCTFCVPANNRLWGHKVRFRSLDHVFGELNYLRQHYAFKSLHFYDDLFIANPNKVMEFVKR